MKHLNCVCVFSLILTGTVMADLATGLMGYWPMP